MSEISVVTGPFLLALIYIADMIRDWIRYFYDLYKRRKKEKKRVGEDQKGESING